MSHVTSTNLDRALVNLGKNAVHARARSGVPGIAIAVVSGDRVVVGELDVGTKTAGGSDRVGADTVFQLASLSKPLTTTVAAWLLSRPNGGSWEDMLAARAPDLALQNPAVTLGSLFAHRSGLPDHAGDLLEDMGYPRLEILHRLRLPPLMPRRPGEDRYACPFAYTNFGFTAAALACAGGSTIDWADIFTRVLGAPLGMKSTSARFSDFVAALDAGNAATPHVRTPAPLAGTPPFPTDAQWKRPPQLRNADAQSPAGGVASTTRDLAQWMRLQLGIIDSPPFDAPFRAQLAKTHQQYVPGDGLYGLGWNVTPANANTPEHWSHSGAFNLGAATSVTLVPQLATGICVLTNGQPLGIPEALCQTFIQDLLSDTPTDFEAILMFFATKMAEALYPLPEPLPPSEPKRPSREASAYTGAYQHPFYGPLQVQGSGGAGHPSLELCVGSKEAQQRYQLEPWNGDVFTYVPAGENGGQQSALTFVADDASGPIQRLGDQHLFAPYDTGNPFPLDVSAYLSDRWSGVYTVDTGLVIDVEGVVRSWKIHALNDNPTALVVYRPVGGSYTPIGQSPLERPTPNQENIFFSAPIPVRPGDRVGFYRPLQGAVGFVLVPNTPYDYGRGNLKGRVWFTAGNATNPSAFEYSSDRLYLIEVQTAWGLRGPGMAKRS